MCSTSHALQYLCCHDDPGYTHRKSDSTGPHTRTSLARESGSARLGWGSNEPNSSVCGGAPGERDAYVYGAPKSLQVGE
jgi:hypothetical protein